MPEIEKVTMPKLPLDTSPAKKATQVNLGQKQKMMPKLKAVPVSLGQEQKTMPKAKAVPVSLGQDRPTRNSADRKKSPY